MLYLKDQKWLLMKEHFNIVTKTSFEMNPNSIQNYYTPPSDYLTFSTSQNGD